MVSSNLPLLPYPLQKRCLLAPASLPTTDSAPFCPSERRKQNNQLWRSDRRCRPLLKRLQLLVHRASMVFLDAWLPQRPSHEIPRFHLIIPLLAICYQFLFTFCPFTVRYIFSYCRLLNTSKDFHHASILPHPYNNM